jgi:HD-like signal output (HDOD) protein
VERNVESNALNGRHGGPEPSGNTKPSGNTNIAFAFGEALAAELSGGMPELPGYPAAVARLQQMLQNEALDLSELVEVIRCEPVIAGQILRIANSAALNPDGVALVDLRKAVARVGLTVVRVAAISFGMTQVRDSPELRGLEQRLDRLWRRNIGVASLSQALARRLTELNADAAMLAGLLQGIGKLYILSRASKHRELFADAQAYRTIEETWHVSIATTVIEAWGVAPEIVAAVRDSEDLERSEPGAPTLSDVLCVAALLTDFADEPATLRAKVAAAGPCRRLKLDYDSCEAFMQASAQEVAALCETLAGA